MSEPVCDVCAEPLDDGRPVQWNLEATGGAHFECLEQETDDEGDAS